MGGTALNAWATLLSPGGLTPDNSLAVVITFSFPPPPLLFVLNDGMVIILELIACQE